MELWREEEENRARKPVVDLTILQVRTKWARKPEVDLTIYDFIRYIFTVLLDFDGKISSCLRYYIPEGLGSMRVSGGDGT